MKNHIINLIRKKINSLTTDQLDTLLYIYIILNTHCNFFMSEQSHIDFMNFYHNTPSKHKHDSYKTLMIILTTQYTHNTTYHYVLILLEMLLENAYPSDIIQTLLIHHQLNQKSA